MRCLDDPSDALGLFSLALRAPAVKMAETFAQRIVGDGLAALEAGGPVICGFDRKIVVRKGFLDELRECSVCRPHAKPMLIIHGTKDDVVTSADIGEFTRQNPLARLLRIEGADHRFKGEGEIQSVVKAAADYFRCE